MPPKGANNQLTGRCYCGKTVLRADARPSVVAYCHCEDCRRVTGAPVSAFAAFAPDEVKITPKPAHVAGEKGVERWFCGACGSPLGATFPYLPDQFYVPIGVLDQADQLAPSLHSHYSARLPWLHIQDDAQKMETSSRSVLNAGA